MKTNKNITIAAAVCLAICTLTSTIVNAQDSIRKKIISQGNPNAYNIKRLIFPSVAMMLSGMLDGTVETISYHYYNGFKIVFPHANDQYWNPAQSWTNKYKDGNAALGPKFMGSTGTFVCFTDAYHALRTARNYVNTFTIAFYLDKQKQSSVKMKLTRILEDALIIAAARNLGFYSTYGLLFKTHTEE